MTEDTIREIEARDALRCKASLEGDAETLAGLLAEGLRYTHSSASVDDKPTYLERVRTGFYTYRGFTDLGRQFQVHGDTALVYGDIRIDVDVGPVEKHVQARYLAVWLREKGAWRLAAWQSTPIPG